MYLISRTFPALFLNNGRGYLNLKMNTCMLRSFEVAGNIDMNAQHTQNLQHGVYKKAVPQTMGLQERSVA